MRDFEVGDVLYHKTNKTQGVIKKVFDRYILVVFEQLISENEESEFSKDSIGEWLFYSKDHINLPVEHLATLNEYSHSKRILEFNEKQKKEKESIREVLEMRAIRNLVHFTRIENLESILTKGFIPRVALEKNNISFYWNDSRRREGKTDCTCFSVEFPNSYLFEEFRRRQPNSKWAVIEVDANVLLEHNGSKHFCYYNAASNDIRDKLFNEGLSSGKDFENMFREKEEYNGISGSGTKLRSTIQGIRNYLPTSVQAEILISGVIPNRYIKCVYFGSEDDYNFFVNTMPSNGNISNFNFSINKLYFLKREQVTFPERRGIIG